MAWEYILVTKRMDKWIVAGDEDLEAGTNVLIDLLNQLGADGWELASTIGEAGQPRVFMKRPKP